MFKCVLCFSGTHISMGRYEKICALAREKGITVREIFVDHLLPLEKRVEIAEKMSLEDDDEYEPDAVYQLCDTPRSQQKLLTYF